MDRPARHTIIIMASNNEAKSVKFACEICLDGIYNIPSLYIIFDSMQLQDINCIACVKMWWQGLVPKKDSCSEALKVHKDKCILNGRGLLTST